MENWIPSFQFVCVVNSELNYSNYSDLSAVLVICLGFEQIQILNDAKSKSNPFEKKMQKKPNQIQILLRQSRNVDKISYKINEFRSINNK